MKLLSIAIVSIALAIAPTAGAQAGPPDRFPLEDGKAGRIDGRPAVFARYVGQTQDKVQGASAAIRASEMLGTRVANHRGDRLGWIAGLLLDTRPRGQHFALLSVEDGGKEKRFVYPLNAFRRGGAGLLLDVPERNLEAAPGYQNRQWPAPEARSGDRYVRARDVLGRPVQDTLGKRVGRMEDMVLDLASARTESVLIDFAEGGILPMPAHTVRLDPRGGATLHPDSQRRS